MNDKTVTIPMWAVLLICVQYAYTHMLTGQCCRPTFACSSKLGLSLEARSGLRMGARALCPPPLSTRPPHHPNTNLSLARAHSQPNLPLLRFLASPLPHSPGAALRDPVYGTPGNAPVEVLIIVEPDLRCARR